MKKVLLVFFIFLVFPVLGLAENTVELNTASLSQLEELVGVGPVTAQKIIDARPFSSVDDLLKVKGIGEKTLEKIKAQGLAYVLGETQQPSQEIKTPETIPAESTPEKIYPSNIFFSEILPAPEGADDTNEWIELKNQNSTEVNLTGWKIQDNEGTMTTYIFPENTTVGANGYLVLKRTQTNITLNNDTDSLNLLSPDDKIVDSINYTEAKVNQSYNKTASGWIWSTILTPGAPNITSLILPKAKKTAKNIAVASLYDTAESAGQKNISPPQLKSSNPWLLFIIAIVITIISGVTILLIKLKLFKNNINTPY